MFTINENKLLNIQGAGERTSYLVTFFSFPTSKEWNTASISNSSVANSSVAKKKKTQFGGQQGSPMGAGACCTSLVTWIQPLEPICRWEKMDDSPELSADLHTCHHVHTHKNNHCKN